MGGFFMNAQIRYSDLWGRQAARQNENVPGQEAEFVPGQNESAHEQTALFRLSKASKRGPVY